MKTNTELCISHASEIISSTGFDSLILLLIEKLSEAASAGKEIEYYHLMNSTGHFPEPKKNEDRFGNEKLWFRDSDRQEFFLALSQIHSYILRNDLPDIVAWTGQYSKDGILPSDYYHQNYETLLGENTGGRRVSFVMSRREEAHEDPYAVVSHLLESQKVACS